MTVRVFVGNSGDVIVCDKGALDTILGGAFTIAVLFKRSGDTFDGTQMLISLHAGVNSNQRGAVSISPTNVLQLTVGGISRTFGFTISDDTWYLFVVKKATGTATPRANLWSYATDAWAGWADAGDTLDTDGGTLVEVRLGAGPGGFGLDGKMGGAVVYSSALSDADGETLEAAAQDWFDLSPAAMWRLNQASVATAVEDDTTGAADQTSISGTSVDTGDDPAPFDFSLGGAEAALSPAALTFTAQALGATPGMVTVSLAAATMTLTAVAVDPDPGPVTAALSPATLGLSAVALAATPGPVSVALSSAALSLVAQTLNATAGAGSAALVPAGMVLAAQPLGAAPGAVTVSLTPAALALAAIVFEFAPGAAQFRSSATSAVTMRPSAAATVKMEVSHA